MAASLVKVFCDNFAKSSRHINRVVFKQFQGSLICAHNGVGSNQLHTSSTQYKSRPPQVCQNSERSMIVCWHPEPDFPYEHTQPLPRDKESLAEGESVLKVQYLLDDKLKNRPDGPTDNELTQIFYTQRDYFRV